MSKQEPSSAPQTPMPLIPLADSSKHVMVASQNKEPWVVMVVDDDMDIHKLTHLVLRNFKFEGRSLFFLDAYSGKEAYTLMEQHPETAVLLLDVVMETENAGLDLVRQIREVLGNRLVRIIIRTGQAGQAPELKIISEYDINDYREKTELTSRKLTSTITSALRGFRDLLTIRSMVHQQKQTEEHLKIAASVFKCAIAQAEEQLKITKKVFENAIEGVIICDHKGEILSVNPAFSAITGFSSAEAVGNSPRMLRSDRQDQQFYANMWKNIADYGQWRGEIWNRRKDGEAYPQYQTITAIHNQDNVVSHYIGVFHDLSPLKAMDQALHYADQAMKRAGQHDALTGLPNRELYIDRLSQAIGHANRKNSKLLLLVFDVDRFQDINNRLGHALGDQLLQQITRRANEFIREGDTLARLGGDAFAFILREIKQPEDAMVVVGKLTKALSRPFVIDQHELFVTASIGITLYPDDGNQAHALMKNADIALTRAKKAGRDNCQFYKPAMGNQVDRRLLLEKHLRQALDNQEFVLHFQPKVDVRSNRIIGMEALVRWNHPESGVVSPGEFIPVAEESGLIIPIGEWILAAACRQNKAWLDAGLGPLKVAVNISPRQFRQPGLYEMVTRTLRETDLPPGSLELEVTESMMVDNVEDATLVLNQLRSIGLSIAMDDFGTGYSSLHYLKRFPIQTLKIDRSFVSDLPDDADDAAIIGAIIALGKNLRLRVVAEGVETQEQLDFLREKGCDEIQGFFYSRPLPADAFVHFLQDKKTL